MGQRGVASYDPHLFQYKSSDLHYLTKMGLNYLNDFLKLGQITLY